MNVLSAVFYLLTMTIIFLMVDGSHLSTKNEDSNTIMIGAIVDKKSRMGMELIVAMEMAIEDFNEINNQSFILQSRDSHLDPLQAFFAVQELVSIRVKAILGPQTWEETSLVAEEGTNNKIPILTFADSTPKWALEKWPFLLQVSPNKDSQMKAVAAIVQSWEWHHVTAIYEDSDSSTSGIFPHLSEALQEVGSEITHSVALPPFPSSSSLTQQLEDLKSRQCRVFVVHLSFQSATRFLLTAKRMKMMEKDYVWITTDGFTSHVHSINASVIKSSMEGVVGVKGYYPENGQKYQVFYNKFLRKFSLEYPEEHKHEPGIFAVQAYDAVFALALAMLKDNNQDLLQNIVGTEYDSLAGNFGFINRSLASMETFQIINLVGKSYRELGFWTMDGHGFSDSSNSSDATYNSSMKILGQVFWPGGPWSTPRGWTLPTSEKPLIIGVPTESIFKQYVMVEYNNELHNNFSFHGYAIELFRAIVAELPFHLAYEFTPFNGTYNELVKQIYLKKFDAAVGDIAIVASRFQYVEFTPPYTESELVMVVPVRSKTDGSKAWLFMRPFTKAMWGLICTITIYNGFVIWLIERNHQSDLRGSILNQMGTLLWLSFTTLFCLQGSKLHSNLSRMTMVVWLFVALVITQTYTATLSSILTTQRLEPTVDSIESLQSRNAIVGHSKVSFVARFLEDVLHFKPHNLKGYTTPQDFVNGLRNREIAAAFLEKPVAKIFLSEYCKGYTMAGPSFKVGGFGFAFPKGSPLLHHVTEALVGVTEKGELQDLEKTMLASLKCVKDNEEMDSKSSSDDDDDEEEAFSLSIGSFWMLFIFSGGTSTVALLVYAISYIITLENTDKYSNFVPLWILMFDVLKHWRQCKKKQRLSRRVSNVDPTTFPPVVNSNLSIQVLP